MFSTCARTPRSEYPGLAFGSDSGPQKLVGRAFAMLGENLRDGFGERPQRQPGCEPEDIRDPERQLDRGVQRVQVSVLFVERRDGQTVPSDIR